MAGNAKVLVVDQDVETRAEVQKGLVQTQFVVVGGVGYGAEALSLASEVKPHLVLVAVEEPSARALQTIEALAELLPNSPILAYSSATDTESVRRAVVAGARDYLTKPLKMREVVKSIQTALSQQERRRALQSGEPVGAVRGSGMVITVFGAKGGIGKTTASTNLATALVAVGAGSAVIVDMDTVFGDAAMLLDVPVETSLIEAAEHVDELDRDKLNAYLTHHSSGLKVLPAPFEPADWRNVDMGAVEKLITLLAQTHDFVVLDCPAGFTDLVAVALDRATVVLLMTSLDITSIKGATTALKLLSSSSYDEDKVKLVINRATGTNSLTEEDVSKVLRREVFWSIPHDEEVADSAQIGTPVVIDRPHSKFAQTIRELAAMLAGIDLPHGNNGRAPEPAGNGLLAKLFSR